MSPSVFVTCVGSPRQAASARLLRESLRAFGGALAGAPFWVWAPGTLDPARIGSDPLTRVVPLEVPDRLRSYWFADKVWAAAESERRAGPDRRSLVWVNPECLFLRPPLDLELPSGFEAAVRPVHLRNVGIPAGEPLDGYWERICRAVGIDGIPGEVESFVDGCRLRSYYNTHLFSVDPSRGLCRRWREAFEALALDREYQSRFCADPAHRIFLHQAILSALLASNGLEKIRPLPPDYSYPYHLQDAIPEGRRAGSLNGLTCAVYEERSLSPDRVRDIGIDEPLRSWLIGHRAP